MALEMNQTSFRKRATAAIVAVTFSFAPMVTKAETLADALVSAYTHSGLLDQNRALLRAADEDVAIAGSALKPVLSWSAGLTQSFGRRRTSNLLPATSNESLTVSLGLTAQLLVYDFGASQFRIDATKETVLRAVSAYMSVIEANETLALRNNNLRLLTQELRAARDRFEVGEVTRTDVALAEAQLAQARSGLAGAEGGLLRAQEEFRNVVGRKPGRLSPPPSLPKLGDNLASAKALAVRRHPLMRGAQHQVAAADLLVRAGDAAMQPTVTLNGQLGLSQSFDSSVSSNTGSIGLNLNQTIYQGGRLSANVRKAMAQRDAQRANLHVIRHNVQQDVGNAYASLLSARAQLEASDRQIRAARIAFRGIREEATLGARTTLDVLDAEQSLQDAELTRVAARTQLYVAAYSVLSATGRLTAQDLKLPVQIYDPAAYYNLVKDSPAKKSKQGDQLDRVLRALQKD